MTSGLLAMARPEPQDLVADRRDDRDEQDAAGDHDQRVLPADERERDDRQEDDDDQELGAAALVRGRVLADGVDGERVVRLEGVDRHVLGAVVLEDAPDVGRPADQHEVAEEDGDPDEALDEVLDQAVLDLGRRDGRDEQRQQEEDPDAGDEGDPQHQRDRALAELDPLLLGLDVGAPDEPAGAHDEGLVQDDQAADERHLRPARAVEARVEALGREDDLAVRVAQGDGDRVTTAHQDALDEGLAAVGEAGHARKSTGLRASDRGRWSGEQ